MKLELNYSVWPKWLSSQISTLQGERLRFSWFLGQTYSFLCVAEKMVITIVGQEGSVSHARATTVIIVWVLHTSLHDAKAEGNDSIKVKPHRFINREINVCLSFPLKSKGLLINGNQSAFHLVETVQSSLLSFSHPCWCSCIQVSVQEQLEAASDFSNLLRFMPSPEVKFSLM